MDSFDYIVVGGGTAGSILAARLSEDPRRTVLLLEAGGTDRGFWVPIPAGFSKLLSGGAFNWRFNTEPEESTYQRPIVVPRGKGLGGSTLINGMIFVRGQSQDYDGWAQMGATGWGWDDVLPYFRKLETFEAADADTSVRGTSGPINIVRVGERPALSKAFLDAAEQAGYARNPDYNGKDQEGFGYYQVNQKNGRRWTVVDGYLRPALSRPNLKVVTHAQALCLALDGRRVTGITYRKGGQDILATARGEVLLAAGAVQSPQLLELSGIGHPQTLKSAGIPLVHALPGVGNNYRDHFATRMNWRVKEPVTLNEQTRGLALAKAVAQYFLTRTGILTLGTGLAHGFVKTRPELAGPDVQYFFMHASYANAADRALDHLPGMTIGVAQLRPQSIGSIHVKSADPFEPPAIRPNFLAVPEDRDCLVEGMKIARRIVDQKAMDPYRAFEMNPGPQTQSDADWLEFARRTGQTIYHPVGTCSMGTGPQAVVDPKLRVVGLDGIRVVDASVMPTIVSANTAAAVMMIAEKAADLIKAEAR
ncbi:GMC family oxidoreductase N-terminal domain-containing protein [Xanthobacter dioxanivorans]|uniref:GMC family oxidoreductase N-terminal domain-containing protein n=1 Tax=Xanthobacter dioxanivorans TaxID=2528964 RepID=A0A974PPH5_9HYPH|nr:GMC family oxidoreductase N-terminal domain-containing protein [Xanthobacter dioxanivorans]QRG07377.1 GMC family oxidoreductase N-terminal domain-containing protein [Xanthobacter dioxanivorans]